MTPLIAPSLSPLSTGPSLSTQTLLWSAPQSRLTSLWTSRCTSRTAWRRCCRPFRRAAPPCPATPAPLGPAVAAGGRGTPPCLMPACPPLTRALCRSSVPSTYSAVSPRHTLQGESESTWHTERHSVKDWCAILSWLFKEFKYFTAKHFSFFWDLCDFNIIYFLLLYFFAGFFVRSFFVLSQTSTYLVSESQMNLLWL